VTRLYGSTSNRTYRVSSGTSSSSPQNPGQARADTGARTFSHTLNPSMSAPAATARMTPGHPPWDRAMAQSTNAAAARSRGESASSGRTCGACEATAATLDLRAALTGRLLEQE